MTAQVVRMPNGSKVTVRSGVLRGAGPQGPMGPQGLQGPKGDTGLQGPPGTVNALRTVYSSSDGVATSSDKWYDVGLDVTATNDLMVASVDRFGLQFAQLGMYLIAGIARFEQRTGTEAGGSSSGSRRLQFVDATGVRLNDECQWAVAAAPSEPTIMLMFAVVEPDPSKKYKLQAQSDDTAGITLSTRMLTVVRVGSGPQGVAGPAGPVGSTGPQGPTGPTGSAGTGYATGDALIGGTDSTLDPGGTPRTTADQALRVPAGTQRPNVPYFISRLAQDLEPLLVARYASGTDRTAKRATRGAGEITVLSDTGVPNFREKNGNDNLLARVIVSAATPPSGSGQAAPGVLWVQT